MTEGMIPVLLLIPVVLSLFHLVGEMTSGELSPRRLAILAAWFLVAAYLQLLGGSTTALVIGLVLQVALAIYLRLRIVMSGG